MSYELRFHPDAPSEWKKLDGSIHELFKKKLAERLHNPRVPARLSGHKDRYKIRLRDAGYRLVYEVRDKVAGNRGRRRGEARAQSGVQDCGEAVMNCEAGHV